MKNNFYTILGISNSASQEEIKKAYRKKAMQFHPDRNPNNLEAEEKFKEISKANEILSDVSKRATYDSQLREEQMRQENAQQASWFNSQSQRNSGISWKQVLFGVFAFIFIFLVISTLAKSSEK